MNNNKQIFELLPYPEFEPQQNGTYIVKVNSISEKIREMNWNQFDKWGSEFPFCLARVTHFYKPIPQQQEQVTDKDLIDAINHPDSFSSQKSFIKEIAKPEQQADGGVDIAQQICLNHAHRNGFYDGHLYDEINQAVQKERERADELREGGMRWKKSYDKLMEDLRISQMLCERWNNRVIQLEQLQSQLEQTKAIKDRIIDAIMSVRGSCLCGHFESCDGSCKPSNQDYVNAINKLFEQPELNQTTKANKVKWPERKQIGSFLQDETLIDENLMREGWNMCIDEFKRLNPEVE